LLDHSIEGSGQLAYFVPRFDINRSIKMPGLDGARAL
jgi:hypothetical protein